MSLYLAIHFYDFIIIHLLQLHTYFIFYHFSVSLSCGGRSNENITYMEMTTTTAPPKSCEYELCPANTNVARIRLDFEVYKDQMCFQKYLN